MKILPAELVIGYDTRFGSRRFAQAAAEVLRLPDSHQAFK